MSEQGDWGWDWEMDLRVRPGETLRDRERRQEAEVLWPRRPDSETESLERMAEDFVAETDGTELHPCPVCDGSGEVHYLAAPPDPQTRMDETCPACGGDGVEACGTCDGGGAPTGCPDCGLVPTGVDMVAAIWAEHMGDVARERRLDPGAHRWGWA